MNGNLDSSTVSRGQTDNVAFDIQENTYAVGFHTLKAAQGFTGLANAIDNFCPITDGKGGVISALLRRHIPQFGGAPLIFLANSKDAQTAQAYMLGLSEDFPYRIVLKKGLLGSGLKVADALRVSAQAWQTPLWFELALQVGVNAQGDIGLIVQRRDPVLTGAWGSVPGMAFLLDDALGRASGQPPVFGDFYVGFGHYSSGASGRVSVFDHLIVERQLTP
jgi:hypothetical protein